MATTSTSAAGYSSGVSTPFTIPSTASAGGLGAGGGYPWFRVGGWYTRFQFNGQTIAFCDVIRETAPQPVARPQPVQPMDQPYPVEITFPMALQAGTLELQIRELWSAEVWAQLGGSYATAQDLLGVFQANLANGSISCSKTILFPTGGARQITYHGCVVTNVQLDEQVSIDTMTIPKTITIMYLKRTEANSASYTGNTGSITFN